MSTTEPTKDELGNEIHPAFGVIGASRVSFTPGAVLFDSDLRHGHYMTVRISTAARHRSSGQDWISGREELVEVAMSESQWASFISTPNAGSGTPCTLVRRDGRGVEELPYAPRLQESFEENTKAAQKAFAEIQKAYQRVANMDPKAPIKERRAALGNLGAVIANAVPNVEFAGKVLAEHAENVVNKAHADIEAYVAAKVDQLGLDASPGGLRELSSPWLPPEGQQ